MESVQLLLNLKNFAEIQEKEDAFQVECQEEHVVMTKMLMVVNTTSQITTMIAKILTVLNTQDSQIYKFTELELEANALTVICPQDQTMLRAVFASNTVALAPALIPNFQSKLETRMLFAMQLEKFQLQDTKGQLTAQILLVTVRQQERNTAQEIVWEEEHALMENVFAIKALQELTVVIEFNFFIRKRLRTSSFRLDEILLLIISLYNYFRTFLINLYDFFTILISMCIN